MTDILFLTLFFLSPFFTYKLMRIADEKFSAINIVSVTVFSLYVFSVIGTFPLYYQLDDFRVAVGISSKEIVLEVLFYSCINIVFFLVGVICYKKINNLKKFSIESASIKKNNKNEFIAMVLLLIISCLVLFFYIQQIDQIALFVALDGDFRDAGVARSAMGNDFQGSYHWYKLFIHGVGQAITFAFLVSWLREKKVVHLVFFIIGFLYSIFAALMATEKAPLVWFILGIFFTYSFVKRNGAVRVRQVGLIASVVVVFLLFMYQLFMGANDFGDAFLLLLSRSFSGSISPAYFYIEYFPYHRDYLWGATFPNPGGVLPYTPVRYTVEVMNWVFPELAMRGIVGSMPTVFWGEAYANFGPIGIPLVAIIVGYLVAAINRWILTVELKPVLLGFYVWVILDVRNLSETGFSGYIYNISILSMLGLLVFVLMAKGKINVNRKNNRNK